MPLAGSSEGVTSYVDGDVHDPDAVLEAAGRTLDLGLTLLAIVQFILDDREAYRVVRRPEVVDIGEPAAVPHSCGVAVKR
ncbi:SAM-dependent methyltransferase [Spirillospora sp. CA-253888]